MAQHQDLCLQRGPRSEDSDQRAPDQSAEADHQPEDSPDSLSMAKRVMIPIETGLYSSTAATVVLARQARANPALKRQAQAGITLATAIMYLRIAAIISIFNLMLATLLIVLLCGLGLAGAAISALQYWLERPANNHAPPAPILPATSANPLSLGPAAVFAVLFIATSVASAFATARFGASGIYALGAIVGVSDIDPFVLNLAQGGTIGIPTKTLAAAILISASSNNMLKAAYAAAFAGGGATAASAAALVFLSFAGIAIAGLLALGF